MDIDTQGAANLFFANSSFPQIYFEATANALDAGATNIQVDIKIESFAKPDTLRITITDNGSGFTDDSFARFGQLLKPLDLLHKGLGRLVYLKYFSQVDVESRFETKKRQFAFSSKWNGKSELTPADEAADKRTHLNFIGFTGDKLKSYDDLKPTMIKDRLVQELLPRLYEMKKSGSNLTIVVSLVTQQGNQSQDFYNDTQTFTLDQLPQLKEVPIKDNAIDLFEEITMAYRIDNEFGKTSIVTAACVDGRTIPLELIPEGGIPNNHAVIFLFTSKFFKADTSRQRLEISDEAMERQLLRVLRKHVAKIISDEIPAVKEKNHTTKTQFIERFPHLLGYFEEETVGLIQKDEALEIAQKRFFKEQKELLESTHLDDDQYQKSLDISSRTLTEYILYRNLIIQKLREINTDNTESEIHSLIVPRYKTFKGTELINGVYSNNAWLLDDKFMSFATILSESRMDKLIAEITLSGEHDDDDGRPDISMIFSNDPTTTEKVDVVIVELKKRTDDEKENSHALTQLLQRAEKLVQHCPSIQRMWYYAVLQISEGFATRLGQMGYSPLFSKGKVFYREANTKTPNGTVVPTPLFVVSFDAVINDADCRNSTFLSILREEMKRLGTKEDLEENQPAPAPS